MKVRAYLLTTTFLLCATGLLLSQTVVEKVLVKSFNLNGSESVDLQLAGNVEVEEWNNDIMRVQMTITAENTSETTIKSLIKAGRYNIKSKEGENTYMVYVPGIEREIRVKGLPLNDDVSYVVSVPHGTFVRLTDESSTDLNPIDEN